MTVTTDHELLRPHAEQVYATELAALAAADDLPRPPSWRLSPRAVVALAQLIAYVNFQARVLAGLTMLRAEQ